MKLKILFFFLLISLAFADTNDDRGCLWILGQCASKCPVGTHSYGSSCTSIAMSAKTCDSPEAYALGMVCDLSRCDCDEPTVLDETTGKCVQLEDCPIGCTT